MNRLRQTFNELQAQGRKVLLPYITAGYPDVETTIAILRQIDPARVGCVELGIPFSDPIADGPVIQTSFSNALARGFKLQRLLDALQAARADIRVPIVLMVSYSVVYRREPERFITAAQEAGCDGLLVPDLSFEEAHDLAERCRAHDFPLIMMVAPTTQPKRRLGIAQLADPWIYYQSLAGVTGERDALPADLTAHVEELRREAGKPVCVGFGISTPEQVRQVCTVADGAIVGSAIVRLMNTAVADDTPRDQLVGQVLEKIATLAAATG
jgi:tryptophan synthase alpha chain